MTDTASTISGVAPLMSVAPLIALLTLTALEIVLGIDNVVFNAILSNAVSASKRSPARRLGLVLAVLTRVLLLVADGMHQHVSRGCVFRDGVRVGGGPDPDTG